MTKLIVTLLFLASLFALPTSSFAGAYIETSFAPVYVKQNNIALSGGGDTILVRQESGFGYDLRNTLGYSFANKILIGASLNFFSEPRKGEATATMDSLDQNTKIFEWGPSLGFFFGGLKIVGTYFVSGKKTITKKMSALDGTPSLDGTEEFKDGSGYQIALGYSLSISPALKIGPALYYRALTYKTKTASNTISPADTTQNYSLGFASKYTEGTFTPMVSLSLSF